MHFAVLAGAAAVLLLARIVLPFFKGVFSPLRTIPGPFAARLGDWWYFWRVWKGDFEVDNVELHKKYGTSSLQHTAKQASPYPSRRQSNSATLHDF